MKKVLAIFGLVFSFASSAMAENWTCYAFDSAGRLYVGNSQFSKARAGEAAIYTCSHYTTVGGCYVSWPTCSFEDTSNSQDQQ